MPWLAIAANKHAGSPYMRGTLCWIAHSARAAELRNVPCAHPATREAHAVPIYPSGMPPNCLCYYTLITTESTLWPITDLVITKNNDVLMM